MANVTETQDLLDELAAMTLISPQNVRVWVKRTTRFVGAFGQQLALLRGLVHDAEDEELTTEVRGKMAAIIQQIDAETRIIGKISAEARSLRVSLEILGEQVAELRQLAGLAGYNVPPEPEPAP